MALGKNTDADLPRRPPEVPSWTVITLCIGGSLYLGLCLPAIRQRGWPAIDPFWTAMPWLWFAPLLIYEILDPRPTRSKARVITWYAIVTAYVDSGTLVMGSPRFVSLVGMAFLTVLVFAPLHLLVAFVLSFAIGLLRRIARRVFASRPRIIAVAKIATASAVLVGAIGFPYAYRIHALARVKNAIREEASEDWRTQRVVRCAYENEHAYNGTNVVHVIDSESGMPIDSWRISFRFRGLGDYAKIYNARVDELIAEHGWPSWSLVDHCVADDDLLAMLDAADFVRIRELPHDVAEGVLVTPNHDGSIHIVARRTEAADSREARWVEGHGRRIGGETIFVGRHPNYANVVFLRRGNRWIGAYHEDGWLLSAAYREESTVAAGVLGRGI